MAYVIGNDCIACVHALMNVRWELFQRATSILSTPKCAPNAAHVLMFAPTRQSAFLDKESDFKNK